MVATDALLFKINGTQQASQIAGMTGKTYKVGKVAAAGNTGLGKMMLLTPTNAAASQGSIALNIEGTRQIAQISGLAGKTVTVCKSPATVGGAGNWLMLHTGKGAAVAAGAVSTAGGAAASKASAGQMILVKAEGGRQMVDMTTLAGKSFTVMKTPVVAGARVGSEWMFLKPAAGSTNQQIVAFKLNGGVGTKTAASLAGKSFTISKAPMAATATAGGHQWLAFKPVSGMAGKGAIAATTATKANEAAAASKAAVAEAGKAGAGKAAVAGAGKAGVGKAAVAEAGKSSIATKIASSAGGGTIWKGTGLSLGLGLGLGAWGPLLLVGAAAVGVGIYGYMRNSAEGEDGDEDM